MDVARIIPLDVAVLKEAERLRTAFGLRLPDATMLASVLGDAASGAPSIFANKNRKDFVGQDIDAELKRRNCKLVANFAAARSYLDSLQGV